MEKNNYQGAMQQAIGSGFNGKSTTREVIKDIDLSGKTVIVTGGSTGIGLETTKVLAVAGATVIVGARDIEKAKKNLEGIANVQIEELDLINPLSIDAFADKFLASSRSLHLLINNAGIMWVPLRKDQRGIESQFAVNFLAQFHLVARLWPALVQANGSRVINVSSSGHQFGDIDFEDLNFEKREYKTLLAYGQSKTACNLFAMELDNRAKNYGVRAYSLHPGSIGGTELAREAPLELFQQMGFIDENGNMPPEVVANLKTIPQGAATTVWCATSPLLEDVGGVYCEDCDVAELNFKNTSGAGVKPYSLDQSKGMRLWELSESLISLKFEIPEFEKVSS